MVGELKNTLKVQRAVKDLTQADLAERARVTRKSVNAIETGRMVPSIVLALRLAGALEVPVETLFRLEEDGLGEKATVEESRDSTGQS